MMNSINWIVIPLQDLNTEKIKFSSLEKVLQEKEKESRKEFVALQSKTRAEISQLKVWRVN